MATSKGCKRNVVLAFGDTHCPFMSSQALSFLKKLRDRYRPSLVVHVGDLVDHHALSTFVKGARSWNAAEELHAARAQIRKLATIFPKMVCILANHDLRYWKRANEIGLPDEYLRSFNEVIEAPKGWTFCEEYEHGGMTFLHGEGYSGLTAGVSMIKHRMTNVIFGHTHSASLVYLNQKFALNTGCLIDPEEYAFAYAKHFKVRPWLGAAVIEDGVPRLEPLR